MSSVEIAKALPDDDSLLLEFFQENPSPGLIQIQLDRSPSYFQSIRVEGTVNDVMIGKEIQTGKIVGTGNRNEKDCYVNGIRERIGYLSALKIVEKYRNSVFLVRAYNFFKTLHKKSEIKFYLTTILAENKIARAILTSLRAGLPVYESLGFYHTYILDKNQKPLTTNSNSIIRIAKKEDLTSIIRFLDLHGKEKQFFPVYTEVDFLEGNSLLNGIKIEDILLAETNNEIVGLLAVWNQGSFRKWIVKGYASYLKYFRILYNLHAYFTKKPRLPSPGLEFKYRFLSLVCIKENDLEVFEALLNSVWKFLSENSDANYLVAGFHEKDILGNEMNKFPNWKITSEVFAVYWKEDKEKLPEFRNGIPYLELGSL